MNTDFTPTQQLDYSVASSTEQAAQALLRNGWIIAAALAVFAVGAVLFAVALAKRRPALAFWRATPKKFHYGLIVLLAALVFLQYLALGSGGSVVLLIVSAAVFVVAAAGLFMRRLFGPVAAVVLLFLALPIRELPLVSTAVGDLRSLGQYSTPARTGVYAVSQMILYRCLIFELIAGVLAAVTAHYYARRRYLFRENQKLWFDGLSACPKCGTVLVEQGDFCPVCGTSVKGKPVSVPRVKFELHRAHCVRCGSELRDGRCPYCQSDEPLRALVFKQTRKALADQLKSWGIVALAAVLVLIPAVLGSATSEMTKGSAAGNNAFVDRLNEWADNSALSKNTQWLADFDASAEALYEFNARGFAIDPGRLSYGELLEYVQYIDASYWQMDAMDGIVLAVRGGDPELAGNSFSAFNETQNRQLQAALSGANATLSGNILQKAERIVVDGLRYWLHFTGFLIPAIVLGLLGAAGVVAAIVLGLPRSDAPFKTVAWEQQDTVTLAIARDQGKRDRRITIAAGVLVVLVFAALFAGNLAKSSRRTENPGYGELMSTAYVENGYVLVRWLALCRTDSASAAAQAQAAADAMDRYAGALEKILACEPDDNVDSEMLSSSKALAETILPLLRRTSEDARKGTLPEQSASSRLIELTREGMIVVSERLWSEAFDKLAG